MNRFASQRVEDKIQLIMKLETLSMLCNPYKGEPFKLVDDTLVGVASGQSFPIRNGWTIMNFRVARILSKA